MKRKNRTVRDDAHYRRTFRYGVNTVSNATGDYDFKFALNAIEQQVGYYEDVAIVFEEVRVESARATFVISPALRYTAAQGGLGFQPIIFGPMHRLLPVGAQSQANALAIAALDVFSPLSKMPTVVWKRRPDDASENEYYPAQGGLGVNYIPASLGGFMLYFDGPISAANLTLGTFIFEYTLTFRGLRYLSNVGPPALLNTSVRPARLIAPTISQCQLPAESKRSNVAGQVAEPDLVDDDVIVLDGKKYCRLGEASNPGPDEGDSDDSDDDSQLNGVIFAGPTSF